MIYSITGTVRALRIDTVIIETGPMQFSVHVNEQTRAWCGNLGEETTLFTHVHAYEGGMDLYGFSTPDELTLFELLIGISGVGPRSALAVLSVGTLDELQAAISERRPDLISRAPGIGKKTAERIVIDLHGKVRANDAEKTVSRIEEDTDLLEALTSLGYRREEARKALKDAEGTTATTERLKAALRTLGRKHQQH